MFLDIDVDVSAASRMLDDIGDRLNNPRALLGRLGDELRAYEADVFSTAGHGTWPGLDAATVAAKGTGRILVDTGNLLAGLTGSGGVDIADDSVSISTDHPAYQYLKSGTGRMPARDPAPTPSSSDLRKWAGDFLDGLLTGHSW